MPPNFHNFVLKHRESYRDKKIVICANGPNLLKHPNIFENRKDYIFIMCNQFYIGIDLLDELSPNFVPDIWSLRGNFPAIYKDFLTAYPHREDILDRFEEVPTILPLDETIEFMKIYKFKKKIPANNGDIARLTKNRFSLRKSSVTVMLGIAGALFPKEIYVMGRGPYYNNQRHFYSSIKEYYKPDTVEYGINQLTKKDIKEIEADALEVENDAIEKLNSLRIERNLNPIIDLDSQL